MERLIKITLNSMKWIFLILISIIFIYPVIYTLIGSLKTNFELVSGGSFLPKEWMFSNYVEALQKLNFAQYSLNSFILCTIVTLLALITSSLAGYVLARHNFPFKKLLQNMYLAFMFISLGAVALYPQYRLVHDLGLTNSLIGLALVLTGGQGTNIFLTMAYVTTLPKELDEAAIIDGCGSFRIYWNIILPLVKPVLGVIALFSFRTAWNDYINSLVFTMASPLLKPLTVAVIGLRYSANAAAEWHIMAAGASIALLPVLIIYIIANKQFISGVTAGAVKG